MTPAVESAWGSATAKGQGGSGDPNILALKEANRIRLLDAGGPVKWRQHGIQSPVDESKFSSGNCPKGPDGRDNLPCPCCMKPVASDGTTQLFPISRRFAANVWDYESNSVKVLIAGPQVFEEFDAAAMVGMDPTASDYVISKLGTGKQTSYKLIRGDSSPLPVQITPDMLHDRDKYGMPDSAESLLRKIEEMGIDYDALETPSFTLDQAEAMVMPYGKHKGMTLEQLAANDLDYMQFIYNSKRDQGSYGDPVFVAMHVLLLDRGVVEDIDDLPSAPPAPAQSASTGQASTPPIPGAGTVRLINTNGEAVDVPEAAKDALLAAGFTEPRNEDTEEGTKTLIGPDGNPVEVPQGAVDVMLAAGFTDPLAGVPATEAPAEPADEDTVAVDIAGTAATMTYAQAKPLIAAGAAKLIEQTAPVEEKLPEPDADEIVQFKLNAVPNEIPMPYGDAKRLFLEGQGDFVGDLAGDYRAFARAGEKLDEQQVQAEVAKAAATDPHPPAGSPSASEPPTPVAAGAEAGAMVSLDPTLTEKGEDGRFRHPALPGKDYATKGPVTQALKKLAQASGAVPAEANGNGEPATGKEAKLEAAKQLLSNMPEIQQDFQVLLAIFQEVAGKRNISEFTEPELDALVVRLQAEKDKAGAAA